MLPLNINQDDEFQCFRDDKFISESTYSMNIGGNNTCIYLVLTDKNNVPYTFYSHDNLNGIIYGIKLYNYNNFASLNMKLQIIPNMYMNQYLNLNEFTILMENFSDYTDTNNMLWDINQTYLKLHNFDELKEIILYDYKRFNSGKDINIIKEQYKKFNYKTLQILYENKVQLNNLRYGIKILIFVSNLYKIIKLTQKIHAYYEIVKINIMLGDFNNNYVINLIKYNSSIISNLFEINYNFAITSGNFETKIYEKISQMCIINYDITLEDINTYQSFCLYIVSYSLNKLPSILNSIISNTSQINNLYHNLYYQIFEQIIIENINYMLQEQIIYDIDNFTNNTNTDVFNNVFYNFELNKKHLFLNQINAYLKLFAFNTTKIDELFNLAKLMGDKEINDVLPINLDSNVVKNNYVYNTSCYTLKTNIPRFKIVDFLNDTILLIEKQSIPIINVDYEIYKKSIAEGIITFILNTIKYFKDIINKIVDIYMNNSLDINTPTEIGNFYNLLNLFVDNYTSFFNILFQNKIDKFYEYKHLKIMFDNLYYSCEEFLLYVSLRNDFINVNTLFFSNNIFINEDLYKIIKTDVFYDFTIKTIQNIDNLVIIKNPQITLPYFEKIKNIVKNKPKIYINDVTIKIINEFIIILKNNIANNINGNDFVEYNSYYIIPYQDLLMLKGTFNWSSFNFKQNVINVVKNINLLNESIFTFYYINPEITDFYKQSLNYTYVEMPYEYININNSNNISL